MHVFDENWIQQSNTFRAASISFCSSYIIFHVIFEAANRGCKHFIFADLPKSNNEMEKRREKKEWNALVPFKNRKAP